MNDSVPVGFDAVLDAAAPLAATFHEGGHRLFLVGGVVRDHWLGVERDDNDLDATTDARPARIKALVAGLADAVWTQGERFGTIGCTIGGRIYEITTHRTEVYSTDSRKPDVAFGDDLRDDLERRDFTVNAMAVDLVQRELVDPFDGRGDLERRVLRTPVAPEVAFSEDPLRMLRAARFHAGYSLEPTADLVAAVSAMGDRMEIVSAERIREELDKLIQLDDPTPGLHFLFDTGLLRWVVPELVDLDRSAIERVGRRVAAVENRPATRWAALLLGVEDPGVRLRALRSSKAHQTAVAELLEAHRWIGTGTMPSGMSSIRRVMAGSRETSIETMIDFLRAVVGVDGDDRGSVGPSLDRLADSVAELRRVEPDVGAPAALLSGGEVIELLGIEEGPDVGRATRWLRELRLDEGIVAADDAARRLAEWWRTDGGN